jgi:hypothetical protein
MTDWFSIQAATAAVPGQVKHACLPCRITGPGGPGSRSGAGPSAGAWPGSRILEPPLTWCEREDGNARNLDGTLSSRERDLAVTRQVSGLLCGEGGLSVKPSAKPTLVRTQHLPPAKPQLRPVRETIRHGESARSGPPRVPPGPPWSSPANIALNCSDTGRTRPRRIRRTGPLPCRSPI